MTLRRIGTLIVGILALALALSPSLKSSGTYVDIPESWHPPIEQAAVVIGRSKQKAVARWFVEFLGRPASVQALQAFGFGVRERAVR